MHYIIWATGRTSLNQNIEEATSMVAPAKETHLGITGKLDTG
jgi:hypothetical protein